ncbi:MAG: HD family hydrolase [Anaerolineales bacterium]|nr:HD family hydrolase [Anaerolineales bacterium]MCB0007848.1 HD family hydrolase [Anaerolineales bacterium]
MDTESILRFWRQDNQLKRTARTGWVQRGVVGAESVAAHSHGVAFVALLLLELIPERLDRAKVLALAILHDLPEALTTDIPAPAWRYLPAGSKPAVESKALDEIFGDLPFAARWRALFTELDADASAEAHLVHDADKLEMYLQAWEYEQEQGNRKLAQFWAVERRFHFPAAQALYDAIRAERARG